MCWQIMVILDTIITQRMKQIIMMIFSLPTAGGLGPRLTPREPPKRLLILLVMLYATLEYSMLYSLFIYIYLYLSLYISLSIYLSLSLYIYIYIHICLYYLLLYHIIAYHIIPYYSIILFYVIFACLRFRGLPVIVILVSAKEAEEDTWEYKLPERQISGGEYRLLLDCEAKGRTITVFLSQTPV